MTSEAEVFWHLFQTTGNILAYLIYRQLTLQ